VMSECRLIGQAPAASAAGLAMVWKVCEVVSNEQYKAITSHLRSGT
jgi:hypothetical protein